jgi:hypothetical protein
MIRMSNRDKRLFELLARYEIIGSKQIRKLLFTHIPETNFFRRMRELEKAKMIRRLGPMTDHSYAWLLGSKGKERMGFGERELFKTRLTLEHDVTLTQVRMALNEIGLGKKFVTESALRKRARLQQTGYLEKKKQVVVPDGLFPVLIKERAEVFALEVELNFKNRLRYQELFKRYLKMDGLYAIWYVVPSKSMGDRLLQEWEAFFEKFRGQYRRKILCYTELDSFLADPRNALIHDHQGEVKISDWWRLPELKDSEKITDHSHDQSVIDETNKKTEAA